MRSGLPPEGPHEKTVSAANAIMLAPTTRSLSPNRRPTGCLLRLTVADNARGSYGFRILMRHIETDVADFLWPAAEAIMESLHQLDVRQSLRVRKGVVAGAWNRGEQEVQAWRRQRVGPNDGDPVWIFLQFGARPPEGSANHVPDDNPVNTLFAGDDFGAQAGMNPGPGIMTRVCPRIGAKAPDDEFVGVRWAFKDIGMIAVQTALPFDDCRSARDQMNGIVMSIGSASGFPVGNDSPVLHVVENLHDEFPLFPHAGRKLVANVSEYPRRYPGAGLSSFRTETWPDLSCKALSGFVKRAKEGRLRYPEGFLHALEQELLRR